MLNRVKLSDAGVEQSSDWFWENTTNEKRKQLINKNPFTKDFELKLIFIKVFFNILFLHNNLTSKVYIF